MRQRAFAERGMGWVCLGTGWWRAGLWLCASWGGSAGQVLHSQGSLGRRGYRADALGGSVATILCSFRPCPAAAWVSGCGWGVRQRVCLGTGWWREGLGLCASCGVAPRDRSCTRRDRSEGGAIALTRWGEVLLRSNARSGPVPLLLPFLGGEQRAFAERGLGGIRSRH